MLCKFLTFLLLIATTFAFAQNNELSIVKTTYDGQFSIVSKLYKEDTTQYASVHDELMSIIDKGYIPEEKTLYGVIDTIKNILIIPVDYDAIHIYSDEVNPILFQVNKDISFSIINSEGNVIVPLNTYSHIEKTQGTKLLKAVGITMDKGFQTAIYEYDGTQLVPPIYAFIDSNFNYPLVSVSTNNRKIGFINHAGKLVIQPKYDFYSGFHEGFAIVAIDDKKGIIDATGKEIVPLKYDTIGVYMKDDKLKIFKQGKVKLTIGETVYYADKLGVITTH